jgi:hypothetical protein
MLSEIFPDIELYNDVCNIETRFDNGVFFFKQMIINESGQFNYNHEIFTNDIDFEWFENYKKKFNYTKIDHEEGYCYVNEILYDNLMYYLILSINDTIPIRTNGVLNPSENDGIPRLHLFKGLVFPLTFEDCMKYQWFCNECNYRKCCCCKQDCEGFDCGCNCNCGDDSECDICFDGYSCEDNSSCECGCNESESECEYEYVEYNYIDFNIPDKTQTELVQISPCA